MRTESLVGRRTFQNGFRSVDDGDTTRVLGKETVTEAHVLARRASVPRNQVTPWTTANDGLSDDVESLIVTSATLLHIGPFCFSGHIPC